MKELKVDFLDYSVESSDIIYFEADWFQREYIFLEIKNFETKSIKNPLRRRYLELNDYLNLKQFKMGII